MCYFIILLRIRTILLLFDQNRCNQIRQFVTTLTYSIHPSSWVSSFESTIIEQDIISPRVAFCRTCLIQYLLILRNIIKVIGTMYSYDMYDSCTGIVIIIIIIINITTIKERVWISGFNPNFNLSSQRFKCSYLPLSL